MGDTPAAMKQLDLLRSAGGDREQLFIAETGILEAEQMWAELKEKVQERFERVPEDRGAYIALAGRLASGSSSQPQKIAEDMFRTVLGVRPDDPTSLMGLAMLLQITGRSAEAVGLYRRLVELDPDEVMAYNNLAWIMCEEQGDCEGALKLAVQALGRAPEYVDLIDTRGVIYYRQGRYNRAIDDFETCLDLYPPGSKAIAATHLHLARALISTGQERLAAEHLEKSLELNEDSEELSAAEAAEARALLRTVTGG
jgi:tetratricopeptide (TPR) repeat protein